MCISDFKERYLESCTWLQKKSPENRDMSVVSTPDEHTFVHDSQPAQVSASNVTKGTGD